MHFGKSSYITVGVVGSVIYGLLWLISLRQTWCAWKLLHDLKNLKLVFHIAMTTYCFLEVLYCGSLIIHDGYARWGYSGHVLALFCYVYAFATVGQFLKYNIAVLKSCGDRSYICGETQCLLEVDLSTPREQACSLLRPISSSPLLPLYSYVSSI